MHWTGQVGGSGEHYRYYEPLHDGRLCRIYILGFPRPAAPRDHLRSALDYNRPSTHRTDISTMSNEE